MQVPDTDRPGPTDAELEVAGLVAQGMTRLFRAANRAKAQDAAGGGEFHALPLLFVLRTMGPLRANELADAIFIDASTVSRQVAQLVEHGYVDRQPDPDDGRATRLALSEHGHEVLERALASRQRHIARMLDGWSTTDRRRFAELLNRFADAFAAHVAGPIPARPDRATEAS